MPYLDDLAISGHAYYAKEHAAGLRACERILATNYGPDADEERVRRNRTWYTPPLQALVGMVRFHRIRVAPARPGWTTFNPTIAADGDGLLGIVRSSNYHVVDGVYHTPPEDEGRIKTRNILVRLGPDGEERSSMELLGPGYDTSDFPIEGMEDLRLYCRYECRGRKAWGVSGTVCDVPGSNGDRRIATATLLPDAGILCGFACPEPPVAGRNEKNWQPVVGEVIGTFVYANWEDGHTAIVVRGINGWVVHPSDLECRPAPWIARGFRGGSQLIPWLDGYLSVVHEVAQLGQRRAYEHRLVQYDDRLRIVAASSPFVFQRHRGIEFCAGAAIVDDRLVMSFGDNDETAWLAFCRMRDVERCLQPVEARG